MFALLWEKCNQMTKKRSNGCTLGRFVGIFLILRFFNLIFSHNMIQIRNNPLIFVILFFFWKEQIQLIHPGIVHPFDFQWNWYPWSCASCKCNDISNNKSTSWSFIAYVMCDWEDFVAVIFTWLELIGYIIVAMFELSGFIFHSNVHVTDSRLLHNQWLIDIEISKTMSMQICWTEDLSWYWRWETNFKHIRPPKDVFGSYKYWPWTII